MRVTMKEAHIVGCIENLRKGLMYAHRYKYGKQTELLTHEAFIEAVDSVHLKLEHRAYIWLLYYSGVRKSEAYELKVEDCILDGDFFIVDFGERKKHGAEVAPLLFPAEWYGIDFIISQWEKQCKARPRTKKVYFQAGKNVTAWKEDKAKWVFPHIQSVTAWSIVKKVLGPEYYPHYLRLNRLSDIGSDPDASILRLKSWSGIKSIRALESYLGVSKREQIKAREYLNKKFRREVNESE